MKKIYFLAFALSGLLLASCSKDHNEASGRVDNSSSVSIDTSLNKTDRSHENGNPTYDASASSKPMTDDNNQHVSTATKEDYSTAPSSSNNKTRVDHSTSSSNARSKNDSTKVNSGVAGEQGAGSGVGNGGSIDGAKGNKSIK